MNQKYIAYDKSSVRFIEIFKNIPEMPEVMSSIQFFQFWKTSFDKYDFDLYCYLSTHNG